MVHRSHPAPWHVALVVLNVLAAAAPCTAQVFLPDDPIWEDPDRLNMPAPEPWSMNDYYDLWINTFGSPGEHDGPALNVNTLGEVPNSSWYTNRHYRRQLTPAELRSGPNSAAGPDTEAPWQVVSAKTEGKTAGMEIEDAQGNRYLLKFDPPGRIELTSGAEMIATKLLNALGYHVPENYVVRFSRSKLVVSDDAAVDMNGEDPPVSDAIIDEILTQAAQYDDGEYRALASKILPGEPLGPFLYYGTRPDDANDVFPHEARRELRGLRLIAAWINHTDARAINTFDVLVEEAGRQFVRHYLIDFGSTFGASPLGRKPRWDGYEYIIDGTAILARTFSLGTAGLHWAAIEYPPLDAVGRIDVEHFDPESWRPQYPNAAFLRMDAADGFWAAKQIMHFSNAEIRAIVGQARYADPAATERMVTVLSGRRDKIGQKYLDFAGGLDRFEVSGDTLTFLDLPARYGHVASDRTREVVWSVFDNDTGRIADPIMATKQIGEAVQIPASSAEFIAADIRTEERGTTRVYLVRDDGMRRVVGVDRFHD